jgi:replicative DNA helicase
MTTTRRPDFEHISTTFDRCIENLKKRTETPEFPFGIRKLDQLTHGLPKGKVTVIGARTSEGKTSFALQQAMRFAILGRPISYVSLEDNKEELCERMLCNYFGIDNQELHRGIVDTATLQKAREAFSHMSIAVLNDYGYSFNEFADLVTGQKIKPEMIFLDYINLLENPRGAKQWDIISDFMRNVKRLSLHENVAIVVCAQVNREGATTPRPALHHLKACGSLEEVADLVLLLHHPVRHDCKDYWGREILERDLETYFEVEVAKNKTGKTGIVPLNFIGQFYRFEDFGNGLVSTQSTRATKETSPLSFLGKEAVAF